MTENRFYTYVYLDPRKPGKYKYGEYEFDYEPFYVGKGCNSRAVLVKNHNILVNNKNNKINESGLRVIILKVKEKIPHDLAFKLEQKLIKLIGKKNTTTGPLVNLTEGGSGNLGYIFSEESKNKISVGNKGKIVSEETRKKQSDASPYKGIGFFNHPHSEESKQKIRENTPRGENHPFYGTHRPDHVKEAVSKANKGKKAWNKGKEGVYSKETLQKMSEARLNIVMPEKTKEKISKTCRSLWTPEKRERHSNQMKQAWLDGKYDKRGK